MGGWPIKTVDEICYVVNGGTPKTGTNEFWGGNHNWITPAEMGKLDEPYISQTKRTITDSGLQNSSARLLPPYSVILSTRAPIGHLVINTEPMATNQGCKGLVPKDKIYFKYIYYYLLSIIPLLNALGHGTTFKELSGGNLKKVPVPVPSLPEQQRIVTILDEAFEGIARAKANAEKNLQNARELFEGYLQSVFTSRGEGWKEKILSQICEVKDGTHDSPKYVDEGIPFVTQKNIRNHGLSFDNTKCIQFSDHEKFFKRSNVEFGDILISMIGANRGMACIVDDKRVFSIKNVGLIKMSINISNQFLLYYLKSPIAMQYIQLMSKGGAQDFISLNVLRNFPVPHPEIDVQHNTVKQLKGIHAEIQSLETIYSKKIIELVELKKSLLDQAFTGKL
jgi:type I restriction enzyme, S subunit